MNHTRDLPHICILCMWNRREQPCLLLMDVNMCILYASKWPTWLLHLIVCVNVCVFNFHDIIMICDMFFFRSKISAMRFLVPNFHCENRKFRRARTLKRGPSNLTSETFRKHIASIFVKKKFFLSKIIVFVFVKNV